MKKIIGLVLALTLVLSGLTTASASWTSIAQAAVKEQANRRYCDNCGTRFQLDQVEDWTCPSCGADRRMEWTCLLCGHENKKLGYNCDFCSQSAEFYDLGGWECEKCGTTNTGNFCYLCGRTRSTIEFGPVVLPDASAASGSWVCPNCGTENTTKFCGECGAARPSETWTCPSCGTENTTKFCGECGAARPSAEATQPPASEP